MSLGYEETSLLAVLLQSERFDEFDFCFANHVCKLTEKIRIMH